MSEQDWSVPETEVLTSIRTLLDGDRDAVVATVVDVEGSAYRRPGAKMLVEEGGEGLGHITAGCLEDEVFELTAEVLAAGEPRIETYDLMNDDEDVWGLGVGCNGIIDILLEPLDEGYRPAVDAFESGERAAMVTVLSGDAPLGAKAYYRDGAIEAESDDFPDWLLAAVEDAAERLAADGTSDSIAIETADGSAEVFVDGIEPTPDLYVFGGGHDVAPLVELGKMNDFRVTVVGYRGAADLRERFPHADAVVATSPGKVGDAIEVDPSTYSVVMTHNFIDDRLTVEALVDAGVPYIGLMGPHERFEEMLEEFEAEGRTFDEEALEAVYTPIGLDLGGATPYGIATSIVGEVLAVHNDREPKHLREREGTIHERVEVPDAAMD